MLKLRHLLGLTATASLAGYSASKATETYALTTRVENLAYSDDGVSIEVETITQPINHQSHQDGNFEQQVIILRPDGVRSDAPVFFFLGNETDHTPKRLIALYKNYGSPKDIIFITADHRGYGQSIPDLDQARPSYVTIKQTMADYARLIDYYKVRFPGAWTGGGCSYGGGLIINFAHDYPEKFKAIIASSALTRFNFETPEYAMQAAINLGPKLTNRLRFHMQALKPKVLYDKNWVRRERLLALVSGLSQQQELQPLKPTVEAWSDLGTEAFIGKIERDLPPALIARIDDFALRRVPRRSLPAAEVRQGNYNWHTWKYQQCTETGTFFTGGLFPHRRADHIADCKATFGQIPPYAKAKAWPVEEMLSNLKIPAVIVSGGRDPWIQVGVKPEHVPKNVNYIYYPSALHCPDIYGAEEGAKAFMMLRSLASI